MEILLSSSLRRRLSRAFHVKCPRTPYTRGSWSCLLPPIRTHQWNTLRVTTQDTVFAHAAPTPFNFYTFLACINACLTCSHSRHSPTRRSFIRPRAVHPFNRYTSIVDKWPAYKSRLSLYSHIYNPYFCRFVILFILLLQETNFNFFLFIYY